MTATYEPVERCPSYVGGRERWDTVRKCNKPVKRDGLCGVHAAAQDRIRRGDAERKAKREVGEEIARELTGLLGLPVHYYGIAGQDEFTISTHAVRQWWEKRNA